MQPITHFELPSDDLDRATSFYAEVFGWDIEEIPMGDDVYTSVITTREGEHSDNATSGGINGAIIDRESPLTHPIITMEVASIDTYLEAVESAGGSVVFPKADADGMGYYAYFEDTEGNVLGLWESLT